MRTVYLSDLFDIYYGSNLELNRLEVCDQGEHGAVRFVSRTNKNNGVVEYVRVINTIEPNPTNSISVAGGGSYVLAAFLQTKPYYSGRDLFYLVPKNSMSELEMLYYCHCITLNRYRYSYGRQANRTLGKLLLPKFVPSWVEKLTIKGLTNNISQPINPHNHLKLNIQKWKYFSFSDLFYIQKGKSTVGKNIQGDIPLVSAINSNNGVIGHIFPVDEPFPANAIAVPMNGVSAGEAYYQRVPFYATTDVNILIPKVTIDPHAALFICTIIRQEKFRFSYGRKWSKGKMETDKIKLPSTEIGIPDFEYMANYIKSLPFSSGLDMEIQVPTVKGLTDEELITKYEAGEINLTEAAEKMINYKENENT